jgi:ATP-dependent 26S proteasome regulatory subunit
MEEMMNRENTQLVSDICRAFNVNPSDTNREQVVEFLTTIPPEMLPVVLSPILENVQILHTENLHLKKGPKQIGVVMNPKFSNGTRPQTMLIKTSSGKPFISELPPHIEVNNLRAGAQVTLSQDGAIIDVSGPHQGYKVGKITYHDATTHEVRIASMAGQGDEELVLLLSDEIRGHKSIKLGARVRYDPELRLATNVEADDSYDNQAQTVLDQLPAHLSWDKLILGQENKDQIEDMYEELLLSLQSGEPIRWMMIVEGAPGVGKTLFAQTLAVELSRHISSDKVAWIFVKGSEPITSLLGESENNIRQIWAKVRENSAQGVVSVVFWDEIESCFPSRTGSHSNRSIYSTITNTLLSEIDGLDPVNNVVFISTTNRADLLDPALLRPNRLGGHILQMQRPAWNESEQLFKVYLDSAVSDLAQPIEALAQQSASYIWAPANIEKYPLAVASFKDGGSEAIPRTALISGDIIRGAVESADRLAKRRKRHGGIGTISIEDIHNSINQLYGGIPLTAHNLSGYVDWEDSKCARVASL